MGLFDRAIGNIINNTISSTKNVIGESVGNAVSDAVGKVTNQAAENITTDMKVEAMSKLPSNCPHCGAPTKKDGNLICEYCGCKIV